MIDVRRGMIDDELEIEYDSGDGSPWGCIGCLLLVILFFVIAGLGMKAIDWAWS